MKHSFLLITFILVSLVQIMAGEKKSKNDKYLENWLEKANLNYQKTHNGYELWHSDEFKANPLILPDSLSNLCDFLYFEAYLEIYRYPKQDYSACDLLKGAKESIIGSVYSKTENGYDVLYLIYELPLDLSSDALYSIVEYTSQYSEKLQLKIIENQKIFELKTQNK
ncbi:hypothetical protein [Marinifilum caeruleilacunae]|uniref:Uncharacterized protein n=1 Tax=Marinifilum caeruleilacunae TaxID=2499076 RepID=A0ABX1WWT6_9BACT|nr:hypothetical protein [Marinifilum caeruleilacunae]NOU60583.1 hypothetical protein [Marinifilum caeruleilacunae]